MGIYIRGMEMPKNYYNCWLGHKCPKYEALLWNEINKERKADCHLVPVPEPHGRLVDADALSKNITGAIYHSELRAAPTVIPASEEGE